VDFIADIIAAFYVKALSSVFLVSDCRELENRCVRWVIISYYYYITMLRLYYNITICYTIILNYH